MLNLTNPKTAPLIARYRAYVEEQNRCIGAEFYAYYNRHVATYQGFLDWCIREGIETKQQ